MRLTLAVILAAILGFISYKAWLEITHLALITLKNSLSLVFLIGLVVGTFLGYWLRPSVEGVDFKALKAQKEKDLARALDEVKKAQEAARGAQRQARKELENEFIEAYAIRDQALETQRLAEKALVSAEQYKKSMVAATKTAKRRKEQILKLKETIRLLKTKIDALKRSTRPL